MGFSDLVKLRIAKRFAANGNLYEPYKDLVQTPEHCDMQNKIFLLLSNMERATQHSI